VKIRILCILTATILCYAQFSSGVDYSVTQKKESSQTGALFHFEKNETEWNVSYGTGNSFTARSDVFGYGLGLYGGNIINELKVIYRADLIFRNMNSSATKDSSSAGDSLIVTNYDIEDITFQDIDAEAGVYFKSAYGLFAKTRYFSFEEADKSTVQYGARAEYSHVFKSGKNLVLSCEFNTTGDDELLKGSVLISEINPQNLYSAALRIPFAASDLKCSLKYFSFDDSLTGDFDAEYIFSELNYSHSFTKAKSSISACLGTNLTAGFDAPRIHLPFFYNNIEFENRLMNDKIALTVGWKYEMYDVFLSGRPDLMTSVPEEIGSAEDISETAAYNKLYVKIGYIY